MPLDDVYSGYLIDSYGGIIAYEFRVFSKSDLQNETALNYSNTKTTPFSHEYVEMAHLAEPFTLNFVSGRYI